MGMFDKDKFFAVAQMEKAVPQDSHFILYAVSVRDGFPLSELDDDGKEKTTRQAILVAAWPDKPEQAFEISTLSGPICDRAEQQETGDFPVVVCWTKVPAGQKGYNEATVLRPIRNPKVDVSKLTGKYVIGEEPVPF